MRIQYQRYAAFVSILAAVAYFPQHAIGQVLFSDITTAAGVAGSDSGGHGLGIGDLNNDGLLDMYVTNSYATDSLLNNLFVNTGNNTFDDIAVEKGVADQAHLGGHGAVFIDIDNDQDLDIFIGNIGSAEYGPDRNTLFRNDGNLNFVDISMASGIGGNERATRGVGGLDVDSDGDLDLVASPFGDLIELFINDGSGSFTRQNRGVEDDLLAKQGVSTVDIDQDGDVDLYVNKWGDTANRLFINDGTGYFHEAADTFGIATDEFHNNGATFADIDNDGDLDLFVISRSAAIPDLQIFRNEDGVFVDETSIHGIVGDGFSAPVGDVDNDGDMDLVVARKNLDYSLYLNDGAGFFTERSGSGIEVSGEDPRAGSFADFDNDGDLDLMVVQKNGNNHYFRNETNNTRFVEVRVIGPGGEKSGMNTKARLYEEGHAGDDYYLVGYREISSSMAYIAQVSPVIHFGLDEVVDHDILLSFPTGEEILLKSVSPGAIMDVDARNQSPQTFDLLSPSPGDTVHEATVLLDWSDSFDPNPWDSVLYDLSYGTSQVFDPSSTFVESNLGESEFNLETALFTHVNTLDVRPETGGREMDLQIASYDDVTIHWKVEARDTRGAVTESTPVQSSFWISKPEAPEPFHLAVPVNRDSVSSGQEVAFVWNSSYDPDPYDSLLSYHLTVYQDSARIDTLWAMLTYGDTSFVAEGFDDAGEFHWDVVAVGQDGLAQRSLDFNLLIVRGGTGTEDEIPGSGNVPKVLALSQNYPNPFNPSTTFNVEIPSEVRGGKQHTEILIYSVRGRLVNTLFNGYLSPGVHTFVWNGRDEQGNSVPSGVFLCVLKRGEETKRVKMLLSK